jgi:choline dehydrogenase
VIGNFDYVVVGAGSAGAVIANRLSEGGRHRVALLEAGPASHWLSPIPIGVGRLINDAKANWCFSAKPDSSLAGRSLPVPRGKLLGGSSSINGLVFVRGQPLDYDIWAQLGNTGWGYEDVLPAFRRMESFGGGDTSLRGRSGPLTVTECPDTNPLYDALFAAADCVGLARNSDYNGIDQEGIATAQTTISAGRRMSVAHCYLKPAMRRDNLAVITQAHVDNLVFDGSRCTGVRYTRSGQTHEATAACEVVLSAGAIKSPQLLELSGIGRADVLARNGITLRHELAGVGEGLRDHLSPRMGWPVLRRGVSFNDRARGMKLGWQVLRYAVTRRGFLSLPTAPVLAFVRTREGLATPDVQLHFMPYTYTAKGELHASPGMTAVIYQMRPESLGSVHIASNDAAAQPEINFNFLDTHTDRQTTIDAVKYTRRLMSAPTFDGLVGNEFKPGPRIQNDDEILDWVRRSAETAYHPVGTCKMGADPLAVVDERLRVKGLVGLRVADASIMPTLVSGNTNAACIMIGERAAEMIAADRL